MQRLMDFDPEIAEAINLETEREEYRLQMIASENFVSEAVMEAAGSVMTNKYAEGYPGKRYYGGCEYVDRAESLAIERAKILFGAEHVNVQPHSGSQANMAVYLAVLEPGDTILGMGLPHGGHLTHGSPVNFSGQLFNAVTYGVREDNKLIDFDNVRELAKKHAPKLIVVGASAYPRVIDFKAFREIADEVGAYVMVDMAHIAGLICTGVHPDPVPYAEFVTTTTHKTLRGPRGGMILCREEFAKAVDKKIFPGTQGGPLMHTIAAKAVAFKEAMSEEFKAYQRQVVENARTLSGELVQKGYEIVTGGTDNHLFLVDLTETGLTGKDAEEALDKAGISVNKNTIPFETRSPFVTSGIRVGTPSITTKGMKGNEMKEIAKFYDTVLANTDNNDILETIKNDVKSLCEAYPMYRDKLA